MRLRICVPISWVMKSPACANMASDLAVDHKDSSPLAAHRSQASRLVGGSAQKGLIADAFPRSKACRRKAKPVEQRGPVSVVTRCGVLSAVIRPWVGLRNSRLRRAHKGHRLTRAPEIGPLARRSRRTKAFSGPLSNRALRQTPRRGGKCRVAAFEGSSPGTRQNTD